MDSFRSFVSAFCVACVFAGGIKILLPEGGASRAVKYMLSLFMLCCMLGVTVGFGDVDFNFNSSLEIQNEELSALAAEQTFSAALSKAGIEFSKITVCTDKTETGRIVISEVVVYSNGDEQKISQLIGSEEYAVRVENE